MTLKQIQESANRSGQTKRVLSVLTCRTAHILLPHLKVQIPRYMVNSYLQTLCGCDCVTPYNFADKPKCVFCGENQIDWPHILFECTECDGNRSKLIDILKKKCTKKHRNPKDDERLGTLSEKLDSLWHSKDFKQLFYLMMGINLHHFNLEYMSVISVVVSTITPFLYRVQRDWDSIN